jgi:hypothetical protein
MNNKIVLDVKNVFGVVRIYPSCDNAKNLCLLMGKQTINQKELALMEKIGFEVSCNQMPLDELKTIKVT